MRSALETCYERGTDCHLPRPARTPLDLEIVHSVTLPPDPPRHVRTRRYAAMSSGAATEIITNARARKMAKQPSAESKPGSSTDSGSSTATSSSDTASSPEIKNDSYSPDTSLEVEPEPMGAAGLDLEDKRV